MINPIQAIASQYANSPIIMQILADWNDDIDPRSNLQDFITKVWNISTAEGYGLDMWGRRVGVSRAIDVPDPSVTYFGFSEGGGYQPFDQAPFYDGYFVSVPFDLSDDDYRTLLLAKALSNINDCSAPVINLILYNLFLAPGRPYAGLKAYVIDIGNMEMQYFFGFVLTDTDLAILTTSGALQRPVGVLSYILTIDTATCFGFAGTGLQPFGQGTFGATIKHTVQS
jgi:hypothetical protein